MQLYPYTASWEENDTHANLKADVTLYTIMDPIPTLEGLSRYKGIPVPTSLDMYW